MAVEKVGVATKGAQFFKESRAELRKVVWPPRQDAIKVTMAVIALAFVAALLLGFMDWISSNVIKFLIG